MVSGSPDARALAAIIGHPVPVSGAVAKVTIGRDGRMHGVSIGGAMGLTTWASFSGSDESGVRAGDIIMTAAEVQPALRGGGRARRGPAPAHGGRGTPVRLHAFLGEGHGAALARGFRSVFDAQAAVARP